MKFLAEHISVSETWEVDKTLWLYAGGVIDTQNGSDARFTILLKSKTSTCKEYGSVFMVYDRINRVYKIYNVYVAPQYRNKGYCAIMISMAVDFAEKYCVDGVDTVIADAKNEIEKHIYEKCGFKVKFYDKYDKRWRMTRGL